MTFFSRSASSALNLISMVLLEANVQTISTIINYYTNTNMEKNIAKNSVDTKNK
jgi:hypothetical protein